MLQENFKQLPRQRRLDKSMQDEVDQMLAAHTDKKLIQQHVLDFTG